MRVYSRALEQDVGLPDCLVPGECALGVSVVRNEEVSRSFSS